MKKLVFLLLASATASEAIMQEPTEPTVQLRQTPVRKRHWTSDEDEHLMQTVQRHFKEELKWKKISNELKNLGITATASQCRTHFNGFLKWEKRKVSGPWTQEEEKRLMERYNLLGPKWTQIAQFFPGRTPMCIHNRYKIIKNRKGQPVPSTQSTIPPAQQLIPTIDNTPADNSISSFDQTDLYLEAISDTFIDTKPDPEKHQLPFLIQNPFDVTSLDIPPLITPVQATPNFNEAGFLDINSLLNHR